MTVRWDGTVDIMTQTVDKSGVHGVVTSEATSNAALHGPKDRSAVKGVVVTESTSNAVLNTATANE